METKTLLAKIHTIYKPNIGVNALITIDARGKGAGIITVERGSTSDSDLELIKKTFHFVRLVQGDHYYRIDKIVTLDDELLRAKLISIRE